MNIDTLGLSQGDSTVLGAPASTSADRKEDLGRDEFLTLFIEQLKHQDPLNPMDSSQFTAQLAQYSSLEQLFNINDHLEVLQSSQEENARLKAIDFMGKEVVVEGDLLSLKQDTTAMGRFNMDEVAECAVRIVDSNGYLVQKLDLGILNPGEHTFKWDGRDEAGSMMAPGIYAFDITATNERGQAISVDTQITGEVSRVNLEGDSPLLYIGTLPVALSQVIDVRDAGDSTTAD